MKVVIIGAGNVGLTSAEALSRVNDVLLVEKDADKADTAKNMLSVSVLHDDGSNPKVLEAAISRMDAEIVLSAIPDDGLNLFICMMAKKIRPSITTVACLRNPDFAVNATVGNCQGVDIMISPELITAEKIFKMATLENAVTYDLISNMNLALATFRVEKGHDLIGKVVMNLDVPDECAILAIYRGDMVITDTQTAEIHVDDRICVLGHPDVMETFNRLIGVEKEAKEFVVIGATIAGVAVARLLTQGGKRRFVKIIDRDESLCRMAARELNDVIVVNADVADPTVLKSENVQRADVIINISQMDELNLLVSIAALKFGTRKIISRYSTKEYEEIFKYTGIESIVGYHRIISNEITKNLVFDENAILTMDHEDESFFSVVLDERSALRNICMGDVRFPEGIRVAAVIREGVIIYPRMNTVFMLGDKILVFTHRANSLKVSKLLGRDVPKEL